MKRNPFVVAATAVMAPSVLLSVAAWRVAAQEQGKTAEASSAAGALRSGRAATVATVAPASLEEWQYPSDPLNDVAFSKCLPFHGLQGKTHDAIEKVYAYYKQKATPGSTADQGFGWEDHVESTLLVNQPARGGYGITAMSAARQVPDNALLVVHQAARTLIIKLSRDAGDRSMTDIVIVDDRH